MLSFGKSCRPRQGRKAKVNMSEGTIIKIVAAEVTRVKFRCRRPDVRGQKTIRASLPRLLLGRVFALVVLSLHANTAPGADALPTLDLKIAFPELKFTRPLWMVEVPDDSKRLFVVEQRGKVLILPQDR